MLWKRSILVLALLIFLFLTIRAINAHGYLGVIMMFNANAGTELLSWDLIISLTLVTIWIVGDARKNGNAFIPFIFITLLFGVAGPLLYLILRDFSLKVQRIEACLLFIILSAYSALTHPLADLRQTTTNSEKTSAARGFEILEQSALAHGFMDWQRHQTLSITAQDKWSGSGWWPDKNQKVRLHLLMGTFTSQAELLNGEGSGQIWGIQTWQPYRGEEGKNSFEIVEEPAPEISFYLPTLQYFAELPFRLLEAEHLIYQGSGHHRGKEYDKVLATWGDPQPNSKYDQYMVWINRETHLIEMVRYTIRDAVQFYSGFQKRIMKPLVVGTIHFEDFADIAGMRLPRVHTITLQPPTLTRYPLAKHYFHRLEISDIQVNKITPEKLLPFDIDRKPSDQKPGTGEHS